MKFKELDFIPLIFANDINVYSVARAFYEKYSVRSYVYGKSEQGTCYLSKLVDYKAVKDCDQKEVIKKLANEFAEAHKEKKILLVGCGDNYVKRIAANKGEYRENIIVPYMDECILSELMDKEQFYKLCEKHGIPYPKTIECTMDNYQSVAPSFKAPYILKPGNGVMYFANPFEGQKKVFILDSFDELCETLEKVYKSGYTDNMIIQDYVPGDDTYMRVLTGFSDKNGKVKMMCLGHVLLEEHTPYGIGNHAVIITEHEEKLVNQFREFLEKIEYKGFFNFDIKFDERSGIYKVFEINVRQGRSNYYVTGAGFNVAEYFVKEFVYGEELSYTECKNENLWMVVPKGVAFRYVKNEEYRKKMKALIKEGKYVNPLWFKPDNGIRRNLKLLKSQMGHYLKFKKYLGN